MMKNNELKFPLKKKRNDLNGVHFKKLSHLQAKYLHEKARKLQSTRTPRNSSLNCKNISLNIEEEIQKFNLRKELVNKKISLEISKLNSPLWASPPPTKKIELPSWTFRNGFRKIVRISRTPMSKYHSKQIYLHELANDNNSTIE
jgi:hypothetical protein